MIGLGLVAVVLWGCASLVTSASFGLVLPWALPRLARLEPTGRARALAVGLVAPAVVGALALVLSFGPCLENLIQGLPDACDQHGGPHIYLCLLRPATPSAVAWLVGAGLLARGAQAMATFVRGVRLTRRLARRLQRLTGPSADDQRRDGYVVVPGRVSFTAGCPHSEIFIGEDLLRTVDEERLAVVVAHEKNHQRRNHVLLKLIARGCSAFHLPHVGRRLAAELETALEEACDAEAARVVGDPLVVAESLVAIARFEASSPAGVFAAFADQPDALSRRVAALCEPSQREKRRRASPLVLLAVLGLMSLAIVLDHRIHDAAEAFLQLLGA